jgi:hypothetical protein
MSGSTAAVVRPGQLLLAVDRDDARAVVRALRDWRGPLDGRQPRHQTEEEHVRDQIRRVAAVLSVLQKAVE